MLPDDAHCPADDSEALLELTVGELLAARAASRPEWIALVDGNAPYDSRRRWTYQQLLDAASVTASLLLDRFAPGDRIAIWGANIPEWEIAQLGAALAGMVVVTVNPALTEHEICYVLRQADVSGAIYQHDMAAGAAGDLLRTAAAGRLADDVMLRLADFADLPTPATPPVLPEVRNTDPVMIQFTSGTTGRPKGAVLSHRNLVNNAYLLGRRLELGPDTVWLNPLPMFHVGGCSFSTLGALCLGATHVLFSFEAGRAIELAESEGATFLPGVPTMIFGMLAHPSFEAAKVASLRNVMVGATTIPAELVHRIQDGLGVRASVVFGQTECSGNATQTYPGDAITDKAETVGRPIPHTELRIVDTSSAATLRPGEIGEIQIRGFGVMLGYHDMIEETAAALDPDGWLRTGDLGSLDERGYLTITGRLKDVIIRGGENIYPRELEDVLIEHPGVAAVAVVGLPDERLGEVVAAVIVAADPAAPPDQHELLALSRDRLARHKLPARWFVQDTLPMTASGKVRKFELRDDLLAQW